MVVVGLVIIRLVQVLRIAQAMCLVIVVTLVVLILMIVLAGIRPVGEEAVVGQRDRARESEKLLLAVDVGRRDTLDQTAPIELDGCNPREVVLQ